MRIYAYYYLITNGKTLTKQAEKKKDLLIIFQQIILSLKLLLMRYRKIKIKFKEIWKKQNIVCSNKFDFQKHQYK